MQVKAKAFTVIILGRFAPNQSNTRLSKTCTIFFFHYFGQLASRGIYTMLDMHQDVMSTKYESYDGIPRWLVDTYPDPMHPYPWPLKNISYWEEGYWTQACR